MTNGDTKKNTGEYVLLSLGSNLGDRQGRLEKAFELLISKKILTNALMSSFYETEPVTIDEQNWFINIAISGRTHLKPEELLKECQTIEKELGREKTGVWTERVIDIDIITYDDKIVNKKNLILPHPRFHKRNFVLIPAAEVAAEVIIPGFDRTIKEIAEGCQDDSEVRIIG